MRFNDALIGVVLLSLAVAIGFYARTLPALPGQEYGAAVFPLLIAWGLGGCGALLIVEGARHWQGAFFGAPWTRSRTSWAKLVVTMALVVFYISASGPLGFLLVSIIVLFALFVMLGTQWWLAGVIAVAMTIAFQKAFGGFLLVPLPRGLLWL
jgi:putative tricarboxylic transport membrane protein